MLFLVYRSANTSDCRIYRRWRTWKFSILRKYRRRLADVERSPVSECVPKLPCSIQHPVVVFRCFITQHWMDIKMTLAWYDLIWFGCSLEIIDIQFPIHYIPGQTKMLAEFSWSHPSIGKWIWCWSEYDAAFIWNNICHVQLSSEKNKRGFINYMLDVSV
jgi:hypothetical protein